MSNAEEIEELRRALGNLLMLNAVREAAATVAPLWLDDAERVFERSMSLATRRKVSVSRKGEA